MYHFFIFITRNYSKLSYFPSFQCHTGLSFDSGHYYTYTFTQNKCTLYNDAEVQNLDTNNVLADKEIQVMLIVDFKGILDGILN